MFFKFLIILAFISSLAFGVDRFPRPEFDTDYKIITQNHPNAVQVNGWLDLAVLVGVLGLATWLLHKKRSRKGIVLTMIFSVIYFGFWRKGCICSVGSLQNVSSSLFNVDSFIGLSTLFVFLIPIIFTLIWGRIFCASACPLGALQELILIKPTKLPEWVKVVFGFFPYIYLALAVLFAATNSGFIICRYDPFVSVFRMSGTFALIVLSFSVLLISTVVARPYCRFACPYGVFLKWAAMISYKRIEITEQECIKCRLCSTSCPTDSIQLPLVEPTMAKRQHNKKLLKIIIILIPVAVLIGGIIGYKSGPFVACANPKVSLNRSLGLEDRDPKSPQTEASLAFRSSGQLRSELVSEVNLIVAKFEIGSALVGAFLALMMMFSLIKLTTYRGSKLFEIDQGNCYGCGRCFKSCPLSRGFNKSPISALR